MGHIQKEKISLLEQRIAFLENGIRKYYMAIYDAKERAGFRQGIIGVTVMCGHEEYMVEESIDGLKQLINELPLHDYGC